MFPLIVVPRQGCPVIRYVSPEVFLSAEYCTKGLVAGGTLPPGDADSVVLQDSLAVCKVDAAYGYNGPQKVEVQRLAREYWVSRRTAQERHAIGILRKIQIAQRCADTLDLAAYLAEFAALSPNVWWRVRRHLERAVLGDLAAVFDDVPRMKKRSPHD